MKFLCDNCKAKYQIADDKVAGKTVRMKCRKCGHLIEIRATEALAEATAFRSLPSEELSRIMDEPAAAPKPAAGAPKPAPRPAAGVAPAPRKTTAPVRPAAGNTTPLRAVGRGSSAATALAPAEPEPASEVEPLTSKATNAPGGLANAFSKSVSAVEPPREEAPAGAFDMGDNDANEEWYAGIGGVPVGPVRLSDLRSKISGGHVTEETLVWREGFEEWVALRTVPALMELYRSAQHPSERVSLAPGGRGRGAVKEKSNVVALRPEAKPMNDEATAIFSGAAGLGLLAEKPAEPAKPSEPAPPAAPAPAVGASLADPFASPDPFAAPDPFGAPAAPVAPLAPASPMMPVAPVLAADMPAPAPPPARIPAAAWVVVVLALAVGVLGGTMLVPSSKEKTNTEVQIVTIEKVVSVPVPDATAAVSSDAPPEASATAKKIVGPAPKTTATAATATTTTTVAGIAPPLVPTSLAPSPLPTPDPPASTETIPASKLQEVVNSHRVSIRRTCWDPMVASGAVGGSVKASISLTIVGGRVTTVNVGGVDGRLGGCIQSRVRGWQFPTGYAATNTSFSLTFVTQG